MQLQVTLGAYSPEIHELEYDVEADLEENKHDRPSIECCNTAPLGVVSSSYIMSVRDICGFKLTKISLILFPKL